MIIDFLPKHVADLINIAVFDEPCVLLSYLEAHGGILIEAPIMSVELHGYEVTV
jgi:hypothetical protein